MIRNKTLITLCGIAILSGAGVAQVISTPPNSASVVDPGVTEREVPKSAHPESDRVASRIVVNLSFVKNALLQYALENEGPLPDHLGRIVGDVPSIEVFVSPGMRVPPEILKGSGLQQSLWVQQHSSYAFPGRGKNMDGLSSEAIILHERFDLEPRRPSLGAIFADGTVKMVERGELERMLRRP